MSFGYEEVVDDYLENKKFDIHDFVCFGFEENALVRAAKFGHLSIVEKILQSKQIHLLNVSAGAHRYSAMHYAVVNFINAATEAIKNTFEKIIDLLIAHPSIHVFKRDCDGNTPLDYLL